MLKFYSPLTGDFYENDVDEFGWNNGTVDYPTLFTGSDMSYYADSIQEAVEQRNGDDGGNLMLYFDESRNPDIKAKVMSAVPSVEIQNGVLMGCTTVKLRESLIAPEMEDLLEYLKGQFSDGWGEGFEQQAIQISNGVLNVHFWNSEHFAFEVVSVQSEESVKKPPVPKRPTMKLIGEDGNIFAILGRASRLLRENGQQEQAKEMT
ncbi:hypothetical protein, partial [Hominenteromicrobium sp.]|uniref:hypothetical protein n=1 Tax=Hominenteromicrobium sp. TaxID=3073581 RepID=UPI003AB12955